MLNYPVQEYMKVEEMNDFLRRFDEVMSNLDDSVYGVMDFNKFLKTKNKIYVQPKKGVAV